MATELGDVIVRMRSQTPPVSYRQIAVQLGISVGRVQREYAKAINGGAAMPSSGGLPAAAPLIDPAVAGDPDVLHRRRQLELRRISLSELDLEARELELRNRLTLLKGSDGSGNAGLAALVLSELNRLRESMAAGAGRQPSMVDSLTEFRAMADLVKSFAPASPVTGADLELQIAVARINEESQRLARKEQTAQEIERIRAEGQAQRDDAIAKLIEGMSPVLSTYLTRRIEEGDKPRPASSSGDQGGQAPAAPRAELTSGSGRGHCPRCGYPPPDAAGHVQEMELTPTGGKDECPGCGALLAVDAGKITLAAAASNGHAPPAPAAGGQQSPPAGPQAFTF